MLVGKIVFIFTIGVLANIIIGQAGLFLQTELNLVHLRLVYKLECSANIDLRHELWG